VFVERERETVTSPAASFDEFVLTHQAGLVRYAALLAGSATQGEDLVQEVLVRLYPRWDQLAEPLPYVRRSITNEFLSWRRRWSTRHIHAVPDQMLQHVQAAATWRAPDPELWEQLQRLPRQQRAAVVLRYYEDLDDDEIGEVLGCKAPSVRGHISRGLATLRASITTWEEDDHA